MPKIIETAFANYHAASPQKQLQIKAGLRGILLFFLYLAYEAVDRGWRKALGIFIAVTVFAMVVFLAGWIGMKIGRIFGEKSGTAVGVAIVFGFFGFVLYIFLSKWGK